MSLNNEVGSMKKKVLYPLFLHFSKSGTTHATSVCTANFKEQTKERMEKMKEYIREEMEKEERKM